MNRVHFEGLRTIVSQKWYPTYGHQNTRCAVGIQVRKIKSSQCLLRPKAPTSHDHRPLSIIGKPFHNTVIIIQAHLFSDSQNWPLQETSDMVVCVCVEESERRRNIEWITVDSGYWDYSRPCFWVLRKEGWGRRGGSLLSTVLHLYSAIPSPSLSLSTFFFPLVRVKWRRGSRLIDAFTCINSKIRPLSPRYLRISPNTNNLK